MNPYIQYMYSYPHKTAYRTLEHIRLQDYAHFLTGGNHGLYLHIPFCEAKCGYCNLFSVPGHPPEEIDLYLDAVERQGRQYRKILSAFQPEFSEITIGGGTPLLLSTHQLTRMFDLLETYFLYDANRRLAIETAPNQTTAEKLKILQQAHVTRISMGIQSFSDQELNTLGRKHNASMARKALELLSSFHFSCVNVDFIYGIPGQDIKSLLASLQEALNFAPDEIFLYPLYLHHGAWLAGKPLQRPQPDFTYCLYQEACAFLKSQNYRQDFMRRFVKIQSKGRQRGFFECGFGTSLALGCGGRSYLGNLHFCTPYEVSAAKCQGQLKSFLFTEDFSQITNGILLSQEEMKRRYIIRHLFIRPGLAQNRYQTHFGTNAIEDFPILTEWICQGYAQITDIQGISFLTLTDTGLGLSDFLGPKLISRQILEKMKNWEAIHDR